VRSWPDRLSDYRADGIGGSATLMIGYGSLPEPAFAPGVREIAEAVRAATAPDPGDGILTVRGGA
jgi:hypothetical protein